MSDTNFDTKETEQKEGFQETFMSHLFELRDRVVKLFYFHHQVYDYSILYLNISNILKFYS